MREDGEEMERKWHVGYFDYLYAGLRPCSVM